MAGSTSINAKQFAPADVYFAPVGEAFPAVEETPAGNWEALALATEITEDGITCGGNIDVSKMFSLGTVTMVKAGINHHEFNVEFSTLDTSLENIALAFGGDPDDVVTTPAGGGAAGFKSIALPSSPVPAQWAFLVRWNQSAYGATFNSQIQIEAGLQVGAGGFKFHKSDPNAQAYSIACLYTGPNWVKAVSQNAAAS